MGPGLNTLGPLCLWQSGGGGDEVVGNDVDLCCHHFGIGNRQLLPWQGYSSEQQQDTVLLWTHTAQRQHTNTNTEATYRKDIYKDNIQVFVAIGPHATNSGKWGIPKMKFGSANQMVLAHSYQIFGHFPFEYAMENKNLPVHCSAHCKIWAVPSQDFAGQI